jgi:hypothetical protein
MHMRLGAIALAITAIICSTASAEWTRSYPVSFSLSDLALSKVDGFDRVQLGDCDFIETVGAPQLPVKYIYIAIPSGERAVSCDVTSQNAIEIPGRYRVEPAQEPVPISLSAIPRVPTAPDPAIYTQLGPYPGQIASLIDTGSLSGHKLVSVALYPVQYIPRSGKLVFHTEINISLRLSQEPGVIIEKRTRKAEGLFCSAARALVANPQEVEGQVAERIVPEGDGVVEYLIITDPDFVDEFQPLADWKTEKGVPTQIVTTSWIYSNYTGPVHNDSQEKIRECIKDYWQHKGLVFALLAGDVAKVPYRAAYACSGNNGEDLPCDLYFADLDGTWNADGDGNYGEYPADGIDMFSDVYTARAPVQSGSEAAVFVGKVLQYEAEPSQSPLPTDYQLKMMFLASRTDDYTDTRFLKEQIDWQSVPYRFDPIDKKYQSWGNLSATLAIAALNEGRNIVNHSGHGNDSVLQTGDDYMDSGQMYGLTNRPRLTGAFYSLSCYSGNFPTHDCVGEEFALAPNGGGFYVGNGHYGWYYVGQPASGLSSRFDRYYFRALFDQSSGNFYNAAQVHCEHKDYGVGIAKGNETERYCLYELNLFGDAEMPIWKNQVCSFDNVTFPSTLPTGQSEFTVTVTWLDYGVPGATVCLCKSGDVYLVGITDEFGKATFHPEPASEGEMLVTVTMPDWLPYQGSATVKESPCQATQAPDPEPYCGGALFGRPATGYPGWVWFSIPLDPANCCGLDNCYAPDTLLGFACSGILWRFDKYSKALHVFNRPFAQWDLEVGDGYLLRLNGPVANPSYMGVLAASPFSTKLGRQGWVWLGLPGLVSLGYPDFMDAVKIEYPIGGEVRTATQDKGSANPWLNWGWTFWDTYGQQPQTFTPYLSFGCNTAYPWFGYRAFVNVGSAQNESDTDQARIIWP